MKALRILAMLGGVASDRVGRCTITNGSQTSTLHFDSPTTEAEAQAERTTTSGATFTSG